MMVAAYVIAAVAACEIAYLQLPTVLDRFHLDVGVVSTFYTGQVAAAVLPGSDHELLAE